MRTTLGCPPKFSSASVITSLEKKCTCCLLHPTGSESSAWFSASPTSTLESHHIPLLVVDLIRMSVVDPPKISFQVHSASSPKNTDIKKKWNEWVKDMACNKNFLQTWNQAGIDDAILVMSVADIRIDQQMMEALFGFWCSATNTFMFPWGEAGFTVEDSHVFTALPLRGSDLDRKLTTEEEELMNRLIVETEKILMLSRVAQRIGTVTCDIWLEWFTNEKDIDDELRHLGFLTYWLCKNVFPSTKLTLTAFFGLAARLSLGDRIALASAIVANIYHDLNAITESIASNQWKNDKRRGGQLKTSAPFSILQCWVWERFESLRPNTQGLILQQSRVRIARWNGSQSKTGYNKAMEIFEDERCFIWRPYSSRLSNWVEPEWYSMDSRAITIEAENTPAYVRDFLALVSCTFVKGFSSDGNIFSERYNPNRFARQFGFDQAIPRATEACQTFNYNECSTTGVQVCIPGITRHGNPRKDYVKWWKTHTESYGETLREHFMPKAAMEKGDNGAGKYWKEKYKATLGNEIENNNNNNTIKKRKAEEIDKHQPVIEAEYSKEPQPLSNTRPLNGSSDSFHEKLVSNSRLPLVEDTGNTAVPSVGISGDKNRNIINIDSDDDVNHTAYDVPPMGFVQEDGVNVIGKNEIALVKELEEFQRLDLMSYRELSPEVEESKKILSLKCKEDPYGQEAIDRYPNFFRLIPQRPHYKGLLKGGNIIEEMKQHIFLGQWYMLVDLMREVLRTNVQTNAAAVEGMFSKAQILEKNGFDVRHLIARLKLVAEKSLGIWKD